MNSALYECETAHQRLSPRRHAFRYKLYYLDLDLAEVETLDRKLRLFSHEGFNLCTFRDKDHLDLGKASLRENLAAWLAPQGVTLAADDRVRLITLPRVLGYIFNPVCFYFISDADGTPRHAVVEVCNTYREVKPWLIGTETSPGYFHLRVPKHFYVSPFTPLTTEFDFRLRVPGDQLEIHIDDVANGETTLVSWLRGARKPLTDFRLAWCAVRFPFLTLQVILKIHWQALRLWLKRLPVFAKTADPDSQADLFRPHSSLKKNTPKQP